MDPENDFEFEDVEPPDDDSHLLLLTDGSGSDRGLVTTCLGMGLRLLGFGWRVGKKVALATAVITSAPVVLPQLVIVSTVGFFFAVPFGVLFAGYAATDKIVKALLPKGHSPVLLPENEGDDTEFFEGVREDWVVEEGEDAFTGHMEEDEGEYKGKEEGKKMGVEEEEEDEEEAVDGKRKQYMEEEEEELPEKKRLERERYDLSEGRGLEEEKGVSPRRVNIPVEEKQTEDGAPEVVRSTRTESNENQLFDATSGGIDVYPVVIEETVYAVSLVEIPQNLVPVVRKVEVSVSRDDKEALSEEKVWEEIDAMRIIVGYKAVRNASFVEELRALYLFTGVEPPISSASSFDLSEVNSNLQFLKSIVGVK